MASLETTSSGNFHIVFRFNGVKYKRALKTKQPAEADSRRVRLEETIRLVKSGRIDLPEDADVANFLLADGKVIKHGSSKLAADSPPLQSLKSTLDAFFASIPEGNLEATTLNGMHRHERDLLRIFRADFPIPTLTGEHLQRYVNRRCKDKTHFGTLVSAATIHKELVTLGTVWRWAERQKIVAGNFPRRGVRLPKTNELPPFQTWDEIDRQIRQGNLTGRAASQLWDALYLRRNEVDDFLSFVKKSDAYPFLYPMIAFAAHTGARRSELLRSQMSDFDFEGGVVTIREKKRVHGRNTTRRVPLSATLREAMTNWFEHHHPGCAQTFCYISLVKRSRSRTKRADPVTGDQAQDRLERVVRGSKWEKVKGWHCLRHSFISNLASQGIDQRIIDDFVGHTTEQMRRRYRHLFPDVKQAAIDAVFGWGSPPLVTTHPVPKLIVRVGVGYDTL